MKVTKIICYMLLIGLFSCVNNDKAYIVLENNGFSEIEFTGYKFLACSKDDWYNTGFIAISEKGRKVKGTVCSGLFFKGSTIRFD